MRGLAFLLTSFLLASILLGAMAVQAGTQEVPEIADAANDQIVTVNTVATPITPCSIAGTQPPVTSGCFTNADLRAVWVDGETSTAFAIHLLVTGTAAPSTLGTAYTWTVAFKVGGTDFTASAHLNGLINGPPVPAAAPLDGALSFGGVAKSGTAAASVITLNILKADVGNPTAATPLTDLVGTASGFPVSQGVVYVITDRAPNTGTGTVPFPFSGAGGAGGNSTGFPNGNPDCATKGTPYRANETATSRADDDGDCLPNYWEQQYFGNKTVANPTADPDGDGFTNYQEYIAGTDPTKASSKPGTPGNDFPNGNPACQYRANETATSKADRDGDCLPNYWEKKFFGNETIAKPTDDPDGDGCNNACEYLNGTDPNDPNSAPPSSCTFKTGETNKVDADGDCLPDYWEKQYFGNITAQNGVGDPDGDGCNNRCEYLHGTDPTKADTDKDGVPDGTEISAGSDPNDPNSVPVASSGTGTKSPLEKITGDVGYVAESTGAALTVVVVSILALVRRWAL